MKKLQLRTFLAMLTVGLGTGAAWSSQSTAAMSAAESHVTVTKGTTARSGKNAGGTSEPVPSIFSADEIPAYLLTDPCDTTDY